MSMRGLCDIRALSIPIRRGVSRYGRVWLMSGSLAASSCAPPATAASPAPQAPRPAPTAPTPTRDYPRIESEVLAALNRARTDPGAVATWLEQLAGYFTGTRLKRPSWPVTINTTEGVSAVREAIAALRAQRPVPALTLNAALTRAARDHVTDHSRTGNTGHTGSDGSTVATRVARYGTWQVSISENIDYAPMVSGRDVIESLIVDDGVRDRGHRRNIFEPSARVVGIACGPHPRFTASCVIVQAGGITSR
jgi:uncharacterized protein YkwD